MAVALHLVWVLMVVTAACGPGDRGTSVQSTRSPAEGPSDSTSSETGILVSEARIIALPNGHGAFYMIVDNRTADDDRLIAVATPVAAIAEMHETTHEDGVMRMRPRPEGLVVPARGRIRLEPGGHHVMLMEMTAVATAQSVQVTLEFENAGPVVVEVPVEGTDSLSDADGQHVH